MRPDTAARALVSVLAAFGAVFLSFAAGMQGSGPDAQEPVRVLKISAGPAGTEREGVFTLTEERSIFSRTTDREVIVFFQWEGSPGPHTLVARWRSPDGALSSSSTLDYVAADRRFGAYWPLVLSPRTPLGTWSVEATVDGQPGGRYTFEIREEKVDAPVVRAPLTPAELYEQLNRVFVVVDRTGHRGQSLEPAGGFVVADGRVCTSLDALDAVEAVHVVGADGVRQPVDAVQAFRRRHGWAVLRVPGVAARSLGDAASESARIGDRLFTIDGGVSGGRMLRRGQMSGQIDNTVPARRLLVSFEDSGGPPGAPVVDEFGDPVGMLAGPPAAGATRTIDRLRMMAALRGHAVIPIASVCTADEGQPRTLAELQAAGDAVLPLAGDEHVVSGGFARGINRSPPAPTGQTEAFSIRDRTFVVFVNWNPVERLRGTTRLRAYDASNTLVAESESKRSNFRRAQFALSFWELPVPRAPGTYRVDVFFDEKPVWRGFFRITP